MKKRYIGLVHSPINNKRGDIVTTSVTNLDIHDIARSARTFGFDGYYIITPVKKQHDLINTILKHWEGDHGNEYNPDRQSALSFIRLANSVEEAQAEIEKEELLQPLMCVTGANFDSFDGGESDLVAKLNVDNKPLFLLFGTGWGLHASITDKADFKLEPLFGCATDGYNHLSVRSAVAIYCDRLCRSL